MTWFPYRAAGKAIVDGARIGVEVSDRLASANALRRAGRGARRGYLAPGDPTPPPSAPTDYLDYRGLARWAEASSLQDDAFPLGAFIDLQRGVRRPGRIGLPPPLMLRHATVIGPAGSGKTHGVLMPWMHAALSCDWSVVAIDVKGDMREQLLRYEQEAGLPPSGAKLAKWDFTDPQRSLTWDWMKELQDDGRIDAAVTAILGRDGGPGVDPILHRRDARTLRGVIRFARAAAPWAKTASGLMRLLDDRQALDALVTRNRSAPGAADLAALLRHPAADYAKEVSGILSVLSVLDAGGVDEVTQTMPLKRTLNLTRTLDEHRALFVVAPLSAGQLSVAVSGLLLGQLQQRLFERLSRSSRRVLLVIDEAAQVMGRIDLARLMELSRTAGVGVALALQDAAQIRNESERSSILSNSATIVSLPGVSSITVEELTKRLGTRPEKGFALSSGGARQGWLASPPTQTYNTEQVPVLREREITQLPFCDWPAIVHIQAREAGVTTKPLLVDLEMRAAALPS